MLTDIFTAIFTAPALSNPVRPSDRREGRATTPQRASTTTDGPPGRCEPARQAIAAFLLLVALSTGLAWGQLPACSPTSVWADDFSHDAATDGQVVASYDAQGQPIPLADDAGRLERALDRAAELDACLCASGQFYVSRPIDISGQCVLGVRHWRDVGFEVIAAQGIGPSAPTWGADDAILFGDQAFHLDGVNVYGDELARYGVRFQGDSGNPELEIRDISIQQTLVAGLHIAASRDIILDRVVTKHNQGDGIVLDRVASARLVAARSTYNLGTGLRIGGDYTATPGQPADILVRYPVIEQNEGNAIWIKDRTQPVFIRGGWLEGQLAHGVLIEDADNVNVRYTNILGSRHPLANGFDPGPITLHGDSRHNTVEDNFVSHSEPVALGWYRNAIGDERTTDLASNTVQHNRKVQVRAPSPIFNPQTQILDPTLPDAYDASPYCGDGTLDASFGELCDDGNRRNGDGCNEVCEIEFCGDGKVQNSATRWEECDLGAGNGPTANCSSTCEDLTVTVPPTPEIKQYHGQVSLLDFSSYTDDTARLEAGLNAAKKHACLVGDGTLVLSRDVRISARCLKGASADNPLILRADPAAAWAPGQPVLEGVADAFVLENVIVDANHVADFAIRLDRSHSARIRQSRFEGARVAGMFLEHTNGIVLRQVTTRDNAGDGAWLESMNGSYAEDLHAVANGGSGLKIFSGGPRPLFEKDPCLKGKSGGMYLHQPVARDNGGHGIEIVSTGSPVIVSGAVITGNQWHGIRLFKAQQAVITDSFISGGDASDSFEDHAIFLDWETWGAVLRDNVVALEDLAAINYPVLARAEHELGAPIPETWNRWQNNVYGDEILPEIEVPSCPTLHGSPIYIFDTQAWVDGDMGGRLGADALALAAVPPGLFAGSYAARALLGGNGIGLEDFPYRMCLDPTSPVVGVDASGAVTGTVANDWQDFIDGTLALTIAEAVGATPATDSFWSGSDNLGGWSKVDCCAWKNDVPSLDEGTISAQMNTTLDWLADPLVVGSCDVPHKLLGLAFAVP